MSGEGEGWYTDVTLLDRMLDNIVDAEYQQPIVELWEGSGNRGESSPASARNGVYAEGSV